MYLSWRKAGPGCYTKTKTECVPTLEKGLAMVRRKRLATCTASSVDRLHRLSPRCSWIHRGSLPRLSARANLCHTYTHLYIHVAVFNHFLIWFVYYSFLTWIRMKWQHSAFLHCELKKQSIGEFIKITFFNTYLQIITRTIAVSDSYPHHCAL